MEKRVVSQQSSLSLKPLDVRFRGKHFLVLVSREGSLSCLRNEIEEVFTRLFPHIRTRIVKELRQSSGAVLPLWYPIEPLLNDNEHIFALSESSEENEETLSGNINITDTEVSSGYMSGRQRDDHLSSVQTNSQLISSAEFRSGQYDNNVQTMEPKSQHLDPGRELHTEKESVDFVRPMAIDSIRRHRNKPMESTSTLNADTVVPRKKKKRDRKVGNKLSEGHASLIAEGNIESCENQALSQIVPGKKSHLEESNSLEEGITNGNTLKVTNKEFVEEVEKITNEHEGNRSEGKQVVSGVNEKFDTSMYQESDINVDKSVSLKKKKKKKSKRRRKETEEENGENIVKQNTPEQNAELITPETKKTVESINKNSPQSDFSLEKKKKRKHSHILGTDKIITESLHESQIHSEDYSNQNKCLESNSKSTDKQTSQEILKQTSLTDAVEEKKYDGSTDMFTDNSPEKQINSGQQHKISSQNQPVTNVTTLNLNDFDSESSSSFSISNYSGEVVRTPKQTKASVANKEHSNNGSKKKEKKVESPIVNTLNVDSFTDIAKHIEEKGKKSTKTSKHEKSANIFESTMTSNYQNTTQLDSADIETTGIVIESKAVRYERRKKKTKPKEVTLSLDETCVEETDKESRVRNWVAKLTHVDKVTTSLNSLKDMQGHQSISNESEVKTKTASERQPLLEDIADDVSSMASFSRKMKTKKQQSLTPNISSSSLPGFLSQKDYMKYQRKIKPCSQKSFSTK